MLLDKLYPLIRQKDLSRYAKLFYKDLIMSLHNQHSSLPAILHPIHNYDPRKGSGIAISIGGTNGYISYFEISSKSTIQFLNRLVFPIPTITTKKDLFEQILKNTNQAIGNNKKFPSIGISFAYPMKPFLRDGRLDGQLITETKERKITGLIGKLIGQEFEDFIYQKFKIRPQVSVANDTICLLLGGKDADIAGVVGTGINFAYWEKRVSIAPLKLSELPNYSQHEVAVNIESANFDKIPPTLLATAVDRKSTTKGQALAEKEAGGAYLYQIFNEGKDKIVGKNFPILSSTDQLSEILTVSLKNTPQSKKAQLFAERLFHRSAQIVAIELCGLLLKLRKTHATVSIVMDGGLFWKGYNYASLVNLYSHMILPDVTLSFARLFGSSRRGIAILARSAI